MVTVTDYWDDLCMSVFVSKGRQTLWCLFFTDNIFAPNRLSLGHIWLDAECSASCRSGTVAVYMYRKACPLLHWLWPWAPQPWLLCRRYRHWEWLHQLISFLWFWMMPVRHQGQLWWLHPDTYFTCSQQGETFTSTSSTTSTLQTPLSSKAVTQVSAGCI